MTVATARMAMVPTKQSLLPIFFQKRQSCLPTFLDLQHGRRCENLLKFLFCWKLYTARLTKLRPNEAFSRWKPLSWVESAGRTVKSPPGPPFSKGGEIGGSVRYRQFPPLKKGDPGGFLSVPLTSWPFRVRCRTRCRHFRVHDRDKRA